MASRTIRDNTSEDGGGGIAITTAAGSVTVIGSTIAENASGGSSGGGVYSESSGVAIVNTTFKHNRTEFGPGGGLFTAGGVVVNTTFGDNHSFSDGGAIAATAALALHNTIVSGPSDPSSFACHGKVTSLDNNLFFDPNCAVALLPHDRTGDPGLGDYIDFGAPGRGFFLPTSNSQALNAGDNAACLPSDQRGSLRSGGCDIGAVEGTTP
jgi:predicted outer membrane repeat protein